MTVPWLRRVIAIAWLAAVTTAVAVLVWAWVGGWQLDVIQSGSMAPTMQRNSLAVVVPATAGVVRKGDVVAFTDRSRGGVPVIHRVRRVIHQHGETFLETKGDANPSVDSWLVPGGDVQGRLVWRARHVGAVVRSLAPPVGPAVLIGVPLLGLVVGEIRARRRRRQFVALDRRIAQGDADRLQLGELLDAMDPAFAA